MAPGADLLFSRSAAFPGPLGVDVRAQVLDVASSALDRGAAAGGGAGGGGGNSVLAGACGVLLLVSGPDSQELQGAVRRLELLLRLWPPAAPPAPLSVLACSGGWVLLQWVFMTLGAGLCHNLMVVGGCFVAALLNSQ